MYLIETTVLLRASGAITEPIGAEALQIIKSDNRQMFISIVSLWELAVLEKSGKLELGTTP